MESKDPAAPVREGEAKYVEALAEALRESGDAFAEQFDRSSPNYHGAVVEQPTPVPLGGCNEGGRVPESMGGDAAGDWRELPEPMPAIENEYPPEYDHAMENYERFGSMKKAISVLNKPVETVMRLRAKHQGAEGEERTMLESRLLGEETVRDGALSAAAAILELIDPEFVSDKARGCVAEVVERGKFPFENKDSFGDFMTTLQRCNQAIFADQRKLLAKIKEIKKKAASGPALTPAAAGS